MRFLGLHLVGVQLDAKVGSIIRYAGSSTHLDSEVEFNMRENGASGPKNRLPSDVGVGSSWDIDGHRWVNRRAQSDPCIGMQGMQPDEMFKRLHDEAAMANEQKKGAGHGPPDTAQPKVEVGRESTSESDP